MRAIDVFFADPVLVPAEDKQYFTEEVRYLPSALGTFFVSPFPEVNELPALSNGVVTFGSLNRLTKLSDQTFCLWAQVLLAVPQSRLLLKTPELDDAATRTRVVEHFTKVGIMADRIIIQGGSSWYEHMQAHHQFDIGLDPFPQGGGIMALEDLMMGVPIINLRGSTLAGRVSASFMTTLGLSDWIAESPEQYIELAIQKTTNVQSLATLRQQLRGIFKSSVLGDQTAYARAVEMEYRKLWQEWCSLQDQLYCDKQGFTYPTS
jgi:Predicted O-linked N-acetylglucosamine transferase, SPINDLY family